jgi:hypothetical protein
MRQEEGSIYSLNTINNGPSCKNGKQTHGDSMDDSNIHLCFRMGKASSVFLFLLFLQIILCETSVACSIPYQVQHSQVE